MSGAPEPREGEIIFYRTPEGTARVEVHFQDETFWLTQKRMAELFDVDVRTISEHLQSIFESGELTQEAVIRKIRNTAADGKSYLTNFYHLDAIIAVGYRVNSRQATQFRIWATQTLREFIIKGFVLDDERLKQGQRFGKDYYEHESHWIFDNKQHTTNTKRQAGRLRYGPNARRGAPARSRGGNTPAPAPGPESINH